MADSIRLSRGLPGAECLKAWNRHGLDRILALCVQDYAGLTADGTAFHPLFAMASDAASGGPTNIYTTTIAP